MELSPRLVFWEITERCNLKCPYCRREGYSRDFSLEESLFTVDSIAEKYKPILVFSGGEPLLYPHLFEVAEYARKKGLNTALATNSTLIDRNLAEKIKQIGFHRVAVSLDGASQELNDVLRGGGAFSKTLAALEYLRFQEVELQINSTVFRRNYKDILSLYRLCLDLGVKALHIFAFVPTGCGMSVPKEERLSAQEYEGFLNQMAGFSSESKIEIKLTCAPHYQRVLSVSQRRLVKSRAKGCLAGTGVCFISARGEIYPCGYLKLSAGNILKKPFRDIWEESVLFRSLRNESYLKGKCGICEFVGICGGCRARAYSDTGDYLQEEPDCAYRPLNAKS